LHIICLEKKQAVHDNKYNITTGAALIFNEIIRHYGFLSCLDIQIAITKLKKPLNIFIKAVSVWSFSLDQLYLTIDLDFVTDNNAAGFSNYIPGQAEFLPANFTGQAESGFGLVIRIDNGTSVLNL
jgi:hypothetical protein